MATAIGHTSPSGNGGVLPPVGDPEADASELGGQSGLDVPVDVWGLPTGAVWYGGTWWPPHPPLSQGALPEPGWYETPARAGLMRWWDGDRWTDDLRYVPRPDEPDALQGVLPVQGGAANEMIGRAPASPGDPDTKAARTVSHLGLVAEVDVWSPPVGPVWHGGTWSLPDPSHSEGSLSEPGWYQSPDRTGFLRWWDGRLD